MKGYRELKKMQTVEMSKFLSDHAIFAFSSEEFEEQAEHKQHGEYVNIGYGFFVLKSDLAYYEELVEKHKREIIDSIEDSEAGAQFAYEMFRCELENHDFAYTLDDVDAMSALVISRKDLLRNVMLVEALKKAKDDILQEFRGEDKTSFMRVFVLDPKEGTPREEMTRGGVQEWRRLCKCDNIDITVRKVCGCEYDFIVDDEGFFKPECRVSAVDSKGGPALVGPIVVCKYDGAGRELGLSENEFFSLMGSVIVLENPETYEKWMALSGVDFV